MTAVPVRRRQRLSAQERREQIVAATVRVLATVGYQATSAEAIAREADVSKGLLWHYFGNQDELMEQTARSTLDVMIHAVGAAIDLAAPAPDVVRSAIRAAADLLQTHAAERRAINEIVVNLRDDDGALRLTMRAYDQMYASQVEIFRRGQADGDFDASLDPLVMAVTYQGAVDGMLGYLEVNPEVDRAAHADAVADVLLGGMMRRSRSRR